MKKFFLVMALMACVFSVHAEKMEGFCITNLTVLPEGLEQLHVEDVEAAMKESGMDVMFINTVSLGETTSYERIVSLQELTEQGSMTYKDFAVLYDNEKGTITLSTSGQDDIMIGVSSMEDGTLLISHAAGVFELRPDDNAFIFVSTTNGTVNIIRLDFSAPEQSPGGER